MRPDVGRAAVFKNFDTERARLQVAYLGSVESLFLALMDRGLTSEVAIQYVSRILHVNVPYVRRDVAIMVKAMGEDFLDFGAQCELNRYDPNMFVFTTRSSLSERSKLATPMHLVFALTEVCGRRCIYCYAAAKYSKAGVMSVNSPVPWEDLAHEAAELGVLAIHITGGEPFLYKGILPLLSSLISNGIATFISTKAHIDKVLSLQIADTGLQEIQVSLDSPVSEVTDFLTGVSGTHVESINSIKNLVAAGLRVKVNTVVTSYNIEYLTQLMTTLKDLGVTRITLSPYTFSVGRHSDDLFISDSQYEWVKGLADSSIVDLDLEAILRYENKIRESASALPIQYRQEQHLICSGGVYGLAIGPTGTVSICERMLDVPAGELGNVIESGGITPLWESSQVESQFVRPDQELFGATACASCAVFDHCDSTRGRCYVRIFGHQGSLYGPDPLCPVLASQ